MEELYRLGQILKAVLQIGAANAGSSLGFQGQTVAAPVFKGVHLFLNDVCRIAGTFHKQLGLFKNRRLYTSITV